MWGRAAWSLRANPDGGLELGGQVSCNRVLSSCGAHLHDLLVRQHLWRPPQPSRDTGRVLAWEVHSERCSLLHALPTLWGPPRWDHVGLLSDELRDGQDVDRASAREKVPGGTSVRGRAPLHHDPGLCGVDGGHHRHPGRVENEAECLLWPGHRRLRDRWRLRFLSHLWRRVESGGVPGHLHEQRGESGARWGRPILELCPLRAVGGAGRRSGRLGLPHHAQRVASGRRGRRGCKGGRRSACKHRSPQDACSGGGW
mmetsp:Transcript_68655/g.160913  ORF Transcript_68655/g.160913 Transcript_68655/m.160913 type:complete len:256 (-) Transcript_68655:100-867(-)